MRYSEKETQESVSSPPACGRRADAPTRMTRWPRSGSWMRLCLCTRIRLRLRRSSPALAAAMAQARATRRPAAIYGRSPRCKRLSPRQSAPISRIHRTGACWVNSGCCWRRCRARMIAAPARRTSCTPEPPSAVAAVRWLSASRQHPARRAGQCVPSCSAAALRASAHTSPPAGAAPGHPHPHP